MPPKKKQAKKKNRISTSIGYCKSCNDWEKKYDNEKIESNKIIDKKINRVKNLEERLKEYGVKIKKLEEKCQRKRTKKKVLKTKIEKMEKKMNLWEKLRPAIKNKIKDYKDEKEFKFTEMELDNKNKSSLLNEILPPLKTFAMSFKLCSENLLGKKNDFDLVKLMLEKLKSNESLKNNYVQDWEYLNDIDFEKTEDNFSEISKILNNTQNIKPTVQQSLLKKEKNLMEISQNKLIFENFKKEEEKDEFAEKEFSLIKKILPSLKIFAMNSQLGYNNLLNNKLCNNFSLINLTLKKLKSNEDLKKEFKQDWEFFNSIDFESSEKDYSKIFNLIKIQNLENSNIELENGKFNNKERKVSETNFIFNKEKVIRVKNISETNKIIENEKIKKNPLILSENTIILENEKNEKQKNDLSETKEILRNHKIELKFELSQTNNFQIEKKIKSENEISENKEILKIGKIEKINEISGNNEILKIEKKIKSENEISENKEIIKKDKLEKIIPILENNKILKNEKIKSDNLKTQVNFDFPTMFNNRNVTVNSENKDNKVDLEKKIGKEIENKKLLNNNLEVIKIKFENLQKDNQNLKFSFENYKKQSEILEKENSDFVKNNDELINMNNYYVKNNKDLKIINLDYYKKNEDLNTINKTLETDNSNLKGKNLELMNLKKDLSVQISELEKNNEILKKEILDLKNKISENNKINKNSIEFKNEKKNNLEKNFKIFESKIISLNEEIVELEKKVLNIKNEILIKSNNIESENKKLTEEQINLDNLIKKEELLKNKLLTIKEEKNNKEEEEKNIEEKYSAEKHSQEKNLENNSSELKISSSIKEEEKINILISENYSLEKKNSIEDKMEQKNLKVKDFKKRDSFEIFDTFLKSSVKKLAKKKNKELKKSIYKQKNELYCTENFNNSNSGLRSPLSLKYHNLEKESKFNKFSQNRLKVLKREKKKLSETKFFWENKNEHLKLEIDNTEKHNLELIQKIEKLKVENETLLQIKQNFDETVNSYQSELDSKVKIIENLKNLLLKKNSLIPLENNNNKIFKEIDILKTREKLPKFSEEFSPEQSKMEKIFEMLKNIEESYITKNVSNNKIKNENIIRIFLKLKKFMWEVINYLMKSFLQPLKILNKGFYYKTKAILKNFWVNNEDNFTKFLEKFDSVKNNDLDDDVLQRFNFKFEDSYDKWICLFKDIDQCISMGINGIN